MIAYFILTCGLSFLETSCNPYILSMGTEETATPGEMLFDHSLWRKVFPYEGSTHIPFLMHIGKNIADLLYFLAN